MSRENRRDLILRAARELLEREPWAGLGLDDVAKAAGVSRQALYLHFGSRGALLLALVEFVDREEGLGEYVEDVRAAPTALEALGRLVTLNATYEPRIRAIAVAHDVARRGDPELEAAWQDRMRGRRRLCAHVTERLEHEGRLAEGLTTGDATDLLWAILSTHVHEDLVGERRWSRRRYDEQLSLLLQRALTR